MHANFWKVNSRWLVLSLLVTQSLLFLDAMAAPLKLWSELDWVDIIGEGGTAVIIYVWFLLVLSSRPAGKVTNYFAAGFLALFVGTFQDFLDELLAFSSSLPWHGFIESAALPLGMFCLTLGLHHWRQEQLSINKQLRKREQIFRQHEHLDPVTQISDLDYMKKHIEISLNKVNQNLESFALVLIDLDNFQSVNGQHGAEEGDKALRAVSELMILNLRDSDLVCRYAGDRFAILLPSTRAYEAEKIAEELCLSIQYFAYRSAIGDRIFLSASAGVACAGNDDTESLLARAKLALLKAKQSVNCVKVAA
jgi:diguanylate cyclase (GGDEF)-like protein